MKKKKKKKKKKTRGWIFERTIKKWKKEFDLQKDKAFLRGV